MNIKDPSGDLKKAFVESLRSFGEAFESIHFEEETPQVSKLRIALLKKYLWDFKDLPSVLRSLGRLPSMYAIKEICECEARIAPRWGVGSTTIIPDFAAAYANIWPEYDRELCSWLIENTTNPYVPFGSRINNREASSWADWQLLFDKRKARKALLASHIEKSNEFRKAVKQDLAASKATRDLPAAIRRGDLLALKSLLEKGADTDRVRENVGSLQALAEEHTRPLVLEFLKSINEV